MTPQTAQRRAVQDDRRVAAAEADMGRPEWKHIKTPPPSTKGPHNQMVGVRLYSLLTALKICQPSCFGGGPLNLTDRPPAAMLTRFPPSG